MTEQSSCLRPRKHGNTGNGCSLRIYLKSCTRIPEIKLKSSTSWGVSLLKYRIVSLGCKNADKQHRLGKAWNNCQSSLHNSVFLCLLNQRNEGGRGGTRRLDVGGGWLFSVQSTMKRKWNLTSGSQARPGERWLSDFAQMLRMPGYLYRRWDRQKFERKTV